MYSNQSKEIELTDVILANTKVIRPSIEDVLKKQIPISDERLENRFYHLTAKYLDSKFFYDEQGNELSESKRTVILFTCYKQALEGLGIVDPTKLFKTAQELTYATIDSICFQQLANYSVLPKTHEQIEEQKPEKKGIFKFLRK